LLGESGSQWGEGFVTFRAVFPARNDEASSGTASKPRLRVLVVDDEPDTVTTLLELLRAEGLEAHGHGSGQAGLDAIKRFNPDVVISDISLPNVDGWTLAREVTKTMGPRRPVLIAITGQHTKEADKVLSHISGFHFYLTKPADPKVLLTLVAGSIGSDK